MLGKNQEVERWSAHELMRYCLEKGEAASTIELKGRDLLITGKVKGKGISPFSLELEAETECNHFIAFAFDPQVYPEIWKFHIGEKLQIAGRFYGAVFRTAYCVIVMEQCRFINSACDLAEEILRDYNRRQATVTDDQKPGPPSLLRQLEDRYLSEPEKEPEPEAVDPRLLTLSDQDPN